MLSFTDSQSNFIQNISVILGLLTVVASWLAFIGKRARKWLNTYVTEVFIANTKSLNEAVAAFKQFTESTSISFRENEARWIKSVEDRAAIGTRIDKLERRVDELT